MAVRLSGFGAPWLLARYVRLWILHRRFNNQPITKLPQSTNPKSAKSRTQETGAHSPSADIVVPIYNNFDDTKALLESLRQEISYHNSLILVNDCSTDERISPMLRAFCAGLNKTVLIENECNLGFVATCNRGIKNATRDVVILNTDIELPNGAVTRMLSSLNRHDDIATVTPFSNSAYGVGVPSLIHNNARPFGAKTDQIDRAFQALEDIDPIDIPRGVGFCMAMSRKVIDRIGPFCSDFGKGYGEEADFCMRARRLGFRSVIAPNAFVYHKGGQSFGGSWQKRARLGQLRFLQRHPSYVNMMRDYLRNGEASGACFSALVVLSRNLSKHQPIVQVTDQRSKHPQHPNGAPVIAIKDLQDRSTASLRYDNERYRFDFADTSLVRDALLVAGVECAEI